jgi:hypothetical protein
MLTAIDMVTAEYLRGTQVCITVASARPAVPHLRLVDPVVLQIPPTLTKVDEAGLQLNVTPSAADAAVAQILRFEKFEADWDGSDAAKPLEESLKEAHAFIRKLSPDSVIPRPALHADGHAILFVRKPDVYAELEFLGNNQIGFYARRGGQKWSDEISFDGQSLPEGLSQIGLSL